MEPRLRVLHLGKYYPPYRGGMENFLGDLLPALERCGVATCAVVHRPWRREHAEFAPPLGCPGPELVTVPAYGSLLYTPLSPGFPGAVAGAARRFGPDLLHLHLPNPAAAWAWWSPEARRVPWVVHWHADVKVNATHWWLHRAYSVYRELEQRLLRRAARVVVTSAAYLEASAPLAEWREKCRGVPIGFAPARLGAPDAARSAAAEAGWGAGAGLRVVAVGRLTYYKGFEILIQAAARVGGVRVVIVGDGELRGELSALIAALGVGERVTLHSGCDDRCLSGWYASADCFCLPSLDRAEAFGMAVVEALWFGLPVITSRIPGSGVSWAAGGGRHGFEVEPGEVDSLVAALSAMAATPVERRRHWGELGHAWAAELQIDRVAQRLAQGYREVVRQ